MEKDEEFVTGDQFYYKGVPNTYSYTTKNYSETCTENVGIFESVDLEGIIMFCFLLLMIVLASLSVLKGISNIKINKQIKKDSYRIKNSKYQDEFNLEKYKIVHKKPVIIYFIYAISSLFLPFVIAIFLFIYNSAAKPIIYIYPEKDTKVKIKVKKPKKLTCTYPKYNDGWNVLAKPNGDLIDLKTNRNLYALYWEGINTVRPNFKEGFIVEGEKVSEFLEEKLEILGLNEREAEEFIIYWLPLMEKNKYNYIRFETLDEINKNMELEIDPKPETLIRINMEFKGIIRPFNIVEQKLEKVERKGYTVVEWGGTKL